MCTCMHFGECCLQTMTMKKIRHQLNAIFGVDLSDRKDFLGAQVCKQKTTYCWVRPESSMIPSHLKPAWLQSECVLWAACMASAVCCACASPCPICIPFVETTGRPCCIHKECPSSFSTNGPAELSSEQTACKTMCHVQMQSLLPQSQLTAGTSLPLSTCSSCLLCIHDCKCLPASGYRGFLHDAQWLRLFLFPLSHTFASSCSHYGL